MSRVGSDFALAGVVGRLGELHDQVQHFSFGCFFRRARDFDPARPLRLAVVPARS